MGEKRSKKRINSKIDTLPEDIKDKVEAMILDTSNTYQEISDWLNNQKYAISKSAVGRYALRTNGATQRLMEAQERTRALVNVVKKNPDADYTEAGMMMLMDGLIQKLASAEEEFDNMPLDKAGRLIASISRTKIYKDKVKQDMMKKIDLAFKGMESEMLRAIKMSPEDTAAFSKILERAKERMLSDD